MDVKFFKTPADFRKWLEHHHQTASELWVGFYKVHTGKKHMTWSQAVDQALCFGWIDSVRKSIDAESYTNRFTPRKPTSVWSNINIEKVKELTRLNLMHPAGLEAYAKRKPEKSGIYSFEQKVLVFSNELLELFIQNKKAWAVFAKLSPSHQKRHVSWVMSAKQHATQLKRLNQVMEYCEMK